jgi:hypothetical protein
MMGRSFRLPAGCPSILLVAMALWCLGGATSPRAQQQPAPSLVRSEDAVVALFALQTQLDVDGKVLRRLELRVEDNRRARDEARDKTAKLYVDLDDLFARYKVAIHSRPQKNDETAPADAVERLQAQIEAKEIEVISSERAEQGLGEDGRRLRQDVLSLKERMTLLASQIDSLHTRLPSTKETVTGVWDITLLPSGDKGVFSLFQSGTLVSGQYVLDGPFQGSLDGTLIDRKLLLHRIDSRLGRSMDFSATLSQDGQALRGTWENYDLSNGQARTGAWAARRRQRKAADESDNGDQGGPQD